MIINERIINDTNPELLADIAEYVEEKKDYLVSVKNLKREHCVLIQPNFKELGRMLANGDLGVFFYGRDETIKQIQNVLRAVEKLYKGKVYIEQEKSPFYEYVPVYKVYLA